MAWFAALGQLRRTSPALRKGELRWLAGEGGLLAFERVFRRERVLCACNAGEQHRELTLPAGKWTVLVGEGAPEGGTLTLPPRSAVILKRGR